MRIIRDIVLLFMLLTTLFAAAQQWESDELGADFKVRYFNYLKDYSDTDVRSSLVKLENSEKNDIALLYIHGFNDYFFQKELAYKFRDNNYAFYAVDLRKYGRSLLPAQKKCQVRSFDEYFADIDSAINVINEDGIDKIVLMGHSTGGLIASYYVMKHEAAPIRALLLNSPFLDWNLGGLEPFVGLVSALGGLFPNVSISSGEGSAYGESLHADFHGEWEFDLNKKSIDPIQVDLGWMKAVNSAQRFLRKHKNKIDIPVLLMYSSHAIDAEVWSPDVHQADVVLDVKDIRKYGLELGSEVSTIEVENGMHDLILSSPEVRYGLYDSIFKWLSWKLKK